MKSSALDLIRERGVYGLDHADGCPCCGFEVFGIAVEVSCRKSSGAGDFCGTVVRVSSRRAEHNADEIAAVAREVARQLAENGYPIRVRFATYKHDAKQLCIYCEKPREDATGYLCAACQQGKDAFGDKIAERFAFPVIELEAA